MSIAKHIVEHIVLGVTSAVPAATGVAATDTAAITAAIAAAGVGGTLRFRAGEYVVEQKLEPLAGQTWIGYGAALKWADQITSTAPGAVNSGATSVTVATGEGSLFDVGQVVAIQNSGGTRWTNYATITDITGDVLTLSSAVTTNDAGNYTAGTAIIHTAGYLIHINNVDRVTIIGLEIDGNSANRDYGMWNNSTAILVSGSSTRLQDLYIHDVRGEAIQEIGTTESTVSTATTAYTTTTFSIPSGEGEDFAVGDLVIYHPASGVTTYDNTFHVITAITPGSPDVITVDTAVTVTSGANGTLYKALRDCRYERLRVEQVRGSGVHYSMSVGTITSHCQFAYCDLTNSGHGPRGTIVFSWDAKHVIIDNNILVGAPAVSNQRGIGLSSVGMTVNAFNNVFRDFNGAGSYAIYGVFSANYEAVNLQFSGNKIYGGLTTGGLYLSSPAGTTELSRIDFANNQFVRAGANICGVSNMNLTGGFFDFSGNTGNGIVSLGTTASEGLAIRGVTFVGGYKAIELGNLAFIGLVIKGCTFVNQNYTGVQLVNHGTTTRSGVTISGNTFLAENSSIINASYRGIDGVPADVKILNNVFAVNKGAAGIHTAIAVDHTVAGRGSVIMGNVFTAPTGTLTNSVNLTAGTGMVVIGNAWWQAAATAGATTPDTTTIANVLIA